MLGLNGQKSFLSTSKWDGLNCFQHFHIIIIIIIIYAFMVIDIIMNSVSDVLSFTLNYYILCCSVLNWCLWIQFVLILWLVEGFVTSEHLPCRLSIMFDWFSHFSLNALMWAHSSVKITRKRSHVVNITHKIILSGNGHSDHFVRSIYEINIRQKLGFDEFYCSYHDCQCD